MRKGCPLCRILAHRVFSQPPELPWPVHRHRRSTQTCAKPDSDKLSFHATPVVEFPPDLVPTTTFQLLTSPPHRRETLSIATNIIHQPNVSREISRVQINRTFLSRPRDLSGFLVDHPSVLFETRSDLRARLSPVSRNSTHRILTALEGNFPLCS